MSVMYSDFVRSIKKDVNHLVQRFEMRKSADAYARTSINKTGVLNTTRLHQYKLTDDIFLRQNVTPDGKSHGLVMYLDWSGSMAPSIIATVKQLIVLVEFCRKVQIDFEVYSFTTGERRLHGIPEDQVGKSANRVSSIINILSSTAKRRQLDTDLENLFGHAYSESYYVRYKNCKRSSILNFGGTPLDNALLLVPAIIDRFRARTGAQKVSFVALTDGQSTPIHYYELSAYGGVRTGYSYHGNIFVKYGNDILDVRSGQNEYDTCAVIRALKKVTSDVTFTNIFIGSRGSCSTHSFHSNSKFDDKAFRTTGGCVSTSDSWDTLAYFNPSNFGVVQEDIEVEDGASKAKIRSALKKYLKSNSNSKTVLLALADQFS